ncbi:hypothetical protein [Tautonia sociabilis]|uniref:Uncharacterized protein n=1 Tax=Tautonia sociabilis TaxID=2080755 RepID=A0A432MMZ2_9BACT|nr:hypothetical protein [Tautonia sociabilis]RUL88811.1 hypothetical protein TsocGM_05495 [Tautonia sociabilis]
MIGTSLVREAPAPGRTGPSRLSPPPVLIEVPTLPGNRPHQARRPSSARVAAAGQVRRRLRREVRLALGIVGIVAASAGPAWLGLRGRWPGADDVRPSPSPSALEAGPATLPDPFAIELRSPIPEPAGAIDPDPWAEGPPVAFPGYLLPGDGDEEHGDERD